MCDAGSVNKAKASEGKARTLVSLGDEDGVRDQWKRAYECWKELEAGLEIGDYKYHYRKTLAIEGKALVLVGLGDEEGARDQWKRAYECWEKFEGE